MLYPEFEAMLDGVVSMLEFADQQMRVAYVLVNARLQIRAAVFFYLDFNEDGSADSGWNIPLRSLAERTGRGPDLGAGPIRLACRSQCPVSWHQMHLWDPDLTPGKNHFVMLRDRIKRNQLGLLVEEEAPQTLPTERLQMVAEDTWYAPDAAKQAATRRTEQLEKEQRLKAAQLIKQQRLRIASLEQMREADLAKLRDLAAQQQATLQNEITRLRGQLLEHEQQTVNLRAQLAEQAEGFQKTLERLSRIGVVFMAYHPGAGHLTIALQDMARYQENPLAYAAAKCAVSEEQYGKWVQHYQQPTCVASLSTGERCNMPLDKVDSPARFVIGESNCCARHRSQDRLRTGS